VSYFSASLAVWRISMARFCFIESSTTPVPDSARALGLNLSLDGR